MLFMWEVDILIHCEDYIPSGDSLAVVTISQPPIDLHFTWPTLVDALIEG